MELDDDLYQLLGVSSTADADEIRAAYKRLARKYHPDLYPGDQIAAERFIKISKAYEVLSDPEKRQVYNRQGCCPETEGVAAGEAGTFINDTGKQVVVQFQILGHGAALWPVAY